MSGGSGGPSPTGVAGRAQEVDAVRRGLDGAARRSSVTVVVGDPGMGKSSLWIHALAAIDAALLVTRPAASEAAAAWTGLADLVRTVPSAVLDGLPEPQRRALGAACLWEAPPDGTVDPHAVAMAFRSVVARLSASTVVVAAVDDVHWLDGPSARCLAFLARRLPATGVAVLATARPPTGPGPARQLLDVPGVERVDLGPVDREGTAAVVRSHLGTVLPRPQIDRIHVASAGNPMMAVELACAGDGRAGEPPRVPRSLDQLVGDRVAGLGDAGRTTLAAVAAVARPTTSLLVAAGLADGLDEAERAGLVTVDRRAVRPVHPLYAAAAYGGCSGADRRTIHARLATVVEDVEERARHAALGTTDPGTEVLDALDRASAAAARRGAPDAAADLATLALDLTAEDDPALLARRLAAAEHLFRSGDGGRARRHAVRIMEEEEETGDRALRHRAALLLAELAWEEDPPETAVAHARTAVALAGGDRERAMAEAALARALGAVDLAASADAAARALALLDPATAEPALLAGVLLAGAEADFELGRGLDRERFARAIELERAAPHHRVADRADAALASLLRFDDDLDGARDALRALRRTVEEEGDESSLPFVLGHLVQGELWAGRWAEAEAAAREHLALAERTGQGSQRRQAEYNLALVAAHQGDDEVVAAVAGPLAEAASAEGDEWSEMLAANVLGLAAAGREDHTATVAHLDTAYRLAERMALRDPGRTRLRTDLVAALLARGERERAVAVLDEYAARAEAIDLASARALVARCRALVAAAAGDDEGAVEALAEAMAQHDRAPGAGFPFDRARTLLVAGRLHRRAKRRRRARQVLDEAGEVFAGLGARRWIAQTEAELARLGSRPAGPDGLTPTERRVAELAAGGLTTRQVADAAFLSPKTVEANLTRIYRKLGVGSRAELGAWFARQR